MPLYLLLCKFTINWTFQNEWLVAGDLQSRDEWLVAGDLLSRDLMPRHVVGRALVAVIQSAPRCACAPSRTARTGAQGLNEVLLLTVFVKQLLQAPARPLLSTHPSTRP